MRPDPLRGPGPDEEDTGWLHGGSRTRMGNEEMRRGGGVIDLDGEGRSNKHIQKMRPHVLNHPAEDIM